MHIYFFHLVEILTHFYLQLLNISQVVLKQEYLLTFLVLNAKRHILDIYLPRNYSQVRKQGISLSAELCSR